MPGRTFRKISVCKKFLRISQNFPTKKPVLNRQYVTVPIWNRKESSLKQPSGKNSLSMPVFFRHCIFSQLIRWMLLMQNTVITPLPMPDIPGRDFLTEFPAHGIFLTDLQRSISSASARSLKKSPFGDLIQNFLKSSMKSEMPALIISTVFLKQPFLSESLNRSNSSEIWFTANI